MDASTQRLLEIIKEYDSISEFLNTHKEQLIHQTLEQCISSLMKKYNIKKSDFIEATGLNKSYVYSVLRDEKTPSRDKIIRFSLSLKSDFNECNELLKLSNHSYLHVKNPRDAIIIYALERNFSVVKVNIIMDNLNFDYI